MQAAQNDDDVAGGGGKRPKYQKITVDVDRFDATFIAVQPFDWTVAQCSKQNIEAFRLHIILVEP